MQLNRREMSATERFNRISVPTNIIFSAVFILLALISVIPLIFVGIISLTSNESIEKLGYSFFPSQWSFDAYSYLWHERSSIGTATFVSVFVTVVGTIVGLFLNATMGYVLSRPTYKLKKFFTIFIFIPMLFNGGLVSSYLVNTQMLKLSNTYWALILPIAVSSFYVIIIRTFFQTTIPDSIIESAKIDGASQMRIFFSIVLPISLPVLATIGLFLSFGYWNDWFSAMLYIQSSHQELYPLQYVLISIEKNMEFLSRSAQYMSPDSSGSKLPSESMRMAIVMLVVIPIALSYPFFQKYFISGLTIGAVKG
ncbi:carbohydrate ABC transporter permease [Paenibacillus montanisoli]|uniref:Carbohydrate ABC transporter permease n=1 Tax=Paenibacillus montanisoli TaxID=2081970 RepID=A0A328TYU0_9BACL|nr:carbohydrate ABC transporter permease [Paenibacillus montanisoli]RAP74922.1 carbohydrate ABC transporter permease [Paenibacillus montanisoli]